MRKFVLAFALFLFTSPAFAATWYVDTVGGNNSNDGTSFAQRKLTINSVTPAADDTIRVMASSPAVDLGVTGAFTNQSLNITQSGATNGTVYLDGAWTALLNVTCSASTTRKEGATSSSAVIASGFTTGLTEFFATGIIDLSAYRQATFWINSSAGNVANTYRIDLCSDALGVVPVTSFTITRALNANKWTPITIDSGSTMSGATAIQSVALTCLLDPGATTVLIDDITVAKGPTATDCLTLNTLVGKNDGDWYNVKSIAGTALVLDGSSQSVVAVGRGYSGTTETVELYAKPVIYATNATGAWQTLTVAGTSGHPVIISGGWSTTDMATQTGDTWWDGFDGVPNGIDIASKNYQTFSKLGYARFVTPANVSNTVGLTYSSCGAVGGSTQFEIVSTTGSSATFTNCTSVNCTAIPFLCSGSAGVLSGVFTGCRALSSLNSDGFSCSAANTIIQGTRYGSCVSKNNLNNGFSINNTSARHYNLTASDNGAAGVTLFSCGAGSTSGDNITGLTTTNNTTSGVVLNGAHTTSREYKINNLVSSGNTTAGLSIATLPFSGAQLTLKNATITDSTKVSFSGATGVGNVRIYSQDEAGLIGASTIYDNFGTITKVAGSGHPWTFSPTSALLNNANVPMSMLLAKVALKSGAHTVSFKTARSSANLNGQLRITGGVYAGVGSAGTDVVTAIDQTAVASPSYPADYTTKTISFTLTNSEVVDIYADWWTSDGGTTYSGYIYGPVTVN